MVRILRYGHLICLGYPQSRVLGEMKWLGSKFSLSIWPRNSNSRPSFLWMHRSWFWFSSTNRHFLLVRFACGCTVPIRKIYHVHTIPIRLVLSNQYCLTSSHTLVTFGRNLSKHWRWSWNYRYGNCFTFNDGMDDSEEPIKVLTSSKPGPSQGLIIM